MVALVVLPGLDATATLHDDFLEAARNSFSSASVLSYPHDRLDYAALETWVRARLPHDAPFVLLGESFSGPIAIAIAADPPQGLCGLVLSTSFASNPVRWLAPLAPLIRSAPLPVPPMRVLSPLLLGRWSSARLEARLRAAVQGVPSRLLRFRASVALEADAASLLQDISVPTLCLRATADRLLSRSCSEQLADSLCDCTVRDIDGPHLLLQARAAACAQAIGDFSRGLQRRT
jgi:pimeloyl-[acyl-carrier protein] methyl ester esterase